MASSSSMFHDFLLSLLLLQALTSLSPSYAQTYHNISLGSSLTPLGENNSWLSPSGEFAFGFYPLETSSSLFLLAIWFVRTANKTVVWYANGDQLVQDGARLELNTDGRLLLKDHNGQEVWNASTSNAAYAAMLDTGNFMLASADDSVRWRSFDHPSDTILPSQVLNLGTELRSRLMDTDYSSGRFKLSVQSDGNLLLYPVSVPSGLEDNAYWSSNTAGNGTKLVFDELGTIYLALNNGSQFNFTSGRMDPMRDFYHRATLDYDGVFRQYVHPKNGIRNGSWNEGWTPADFQPPNICQAVFTFTGGGACGFNSYCKFGSNKRVDCECPPQYSFLDPNRKYKGCQPNFAAQNCDADEKEIQSLYDMSVMIDVDWPQSDYDHYKPLDEDGCRRECLRDCFCAVALYHNGDCWKKKLPLTNGKMGTFIQSTVFIKVSKAQNYSKISLGSSLSTLDDGNNSWVSPSGDFAFGFLPLGADSNLFLLGIWFNKVSDKAVVWSANRNGSVPRGSKVELTDSGRLVLYDEQGQEAWSANAKGAASAAMLDTGNFVLINESNSYIWESFNNPTDTILPTQVLGPGIQLYSRLAGNNYSPGRFKLSIQNDGNLVFYSVNVPTGYQYEPYWSSNATGTGTHLVFNSSGYLCLNQMNGSILPLTQSSGMVSTEDYYHRATLDSDGVLRQYYYPKPNSSASGRPESWSVLWHLPDNICLQVSGSIGSGACGFNSLCKLRDDGRPTCECPPGYSFLDSSNMYMGCKPHGMLTCELTDLLTVMNVDWPTGDYEVLSPVTEHDCSQACLGDCLCAVAIYRNESCWKKKLPLSNGREDPQTDGKALIKIATVAPPGRAKNQHTLILILSIILGGSALLNLLPLISLANSFFGHKKRSKPDASIIGTHLRSFSYRELEVATDEFKEELGHGSFGTVYKGRLVLDAEILIAVKMLNKVAQQGEKEFRTEVSVIGQTNHKNLVRLLGFCDEGVHRLLVYEFMSNGSLADFLFGSIKPTWDQQARIAIEIARGLAYLHEECSSPIIHCDIKPQNVLLDDCFTARISDFGLAKLLRTNQSRTSTGIRGTRGYVAPEWFRRTAITAKVDVYSFGVMLLEIICCRKSIEPEAGSGDILVYWAYDLYREGRLDKLVENGNEAINDARRLERFVMVAIWCVQEEPMMRPDMKRVAIMLEGHADVPEPPSPSSPIEQFL